MSTHIRTCVVTSEVKGQGHQTECRDRKPAISSAREGLNFKLGIAYYTDGAQRLALTSAMTSKGGGGAGNIAAVAIHTGHTTC